MLDAFQREIDIPEIFTPTKTIVCYCLYYSFEWHAMKYFKHNILNSSDKFDDINSFLNELTDYKFIIKGEIDIDNNDEMELINTFYDNDKITFRIDSFVLRGGTAFKELVL